MAQQVNMPRQQANSLDDLANLTKIGTSIYSVISDVRRSEREAKKLENAEAEAARLKNGIYYPTEALKKANEIGFVPITRQEAATRADAQKYGTDALSGESLWGYSAKREANDVARNRLDITNQLLSLNFEKFSTSQKNRAEDILRGKEKELKTDVKDLTETYTRNKIIPVYSSLKTLDKLLGGLYSSENIPGWGGGEQLISDKVYGQRVKDIRSNLATLENNLGHALFGGSRTSNELASLVKQLRTNRLSTDAQLRSGLQTVAKGFQEEIANIERGFTDSVRAEAFKKGILSSRDRVFSGGGLLPVAEQQQQQTQPPGAPQFGGGQAPAANRPSVTTPDGATVYVGDVFTGKDGKRYRLLDAKGQVEEAK